MGFVVKQTSSHPRSFQKEDWRVLELHEEAQECGSTLQRTTFEKVELQIPPLLCSIKTLKGEVWWADTPTSMLPGISRKRKVRSKVWWFTGFCNSHYVSHFAAFFIDVGTKTSVAESCIGISFFETRMNFSIHLVFEKVLSLAMEAGWNWGLGFGFWCFVCLVSPEPTGSKIQKKRVHGCLCPLARNTFVKLCVEWSYRRFTYGNLVTTSPSSKSKDLHKFQSTASLASHHQLSWGLIITFDR